MKGAPVYVIKKLHRHELGHMKELIGFRKNRIFWQQFSDGFPSYRHYGIQLSDGSYVHFSGHMQTLQPNAWIRHTNREQFAAGDKIYFADDVCCFFSAEQIAQRALSQVGGNFGGYNFLRNNCEHFVNWCANGCCISKQVYFRS